MFQTPKDILPHILENCKSNFHQTKKNENKTDENSCFHTVHYSPISEQEEESIKLHIKSISDKDIHELINDLPLTFEKKQTLHFIVANHKDGVCEKPYSFILKGINMQRLNSPNSKKAITKSALATRLRNLESLGLITRHPLKGFFGTKIFITIHLEKIQNMVDNSQLSLMLERNQIHTIENHKLVITHKENKYKKSKKISPISIIKRLFIQTIQNEIFNISKKQIESISQWFDQKIATKYATKWHFMNKDKYPDFNNAIENAIDYLYNMKPKHSYG